MGRAAPPLHLAPTLLLGLAWLAAFPASAQSPGPPQNQGLVVRDGTLGSALGGVVPPGPDDLGTANYLIRADLGQQRGGNLFHSFKYFSIGSGERATFTADGAPNPGAINNVISRVTGGEPSQIDGVLHSMIPGADVWLLNPRGVVFGQGAKLDVPASFHASTGDYVSFGTDGLERFYSDPSMPRVLSTATPVAFGFLSPSGAALLAVDRSTLEVPDGKTLELAGGDVSLTLDAALRAPGGDVRLEAQGEALISQSGVYVSRDGGTPGTISIRGGEIRVEKSSLLSAENESGVPSADPNRPGPGMISVAASESVLVDASLLSVSTHGAGNAGMIDIASPEITLQQGLGFDPLAPPRENPAGARAETTSSGAAGEIKIQAENLVTLANGVGVSASAVGAGTSGDAGTVEIAARKVGLKRDSYVTAETAGTGDGGAISIEAGESLLVDNSLLSVNTWSTGNAGTISVQSPDVTFENGPGFRDPDRDNVPHAIEVGARAETGSSGKGGLIDIDAGSVTVANGAAVSANTFGSGATGDAGKIEISATDRVDVSVAKLPGGSAPFSTITAASWGSLGNGGVIEIEAGTVRVDGADDPRSIAAIGTDSARRYGMDTPLLQSIPGAPGTVRITADTVEVVNGGIIESTCYGCTSKTQGRDPEAGLVQIVADDLVLSGTVGNASRVAAETAPEGAASEGDGGRIVIGAGSVSISGGSVISALTSGSGTGGTITVNADSIEVSGGTINAQTSGTGRGGTITVDTGSLVIGNGAIDVGSYPGPNGGGNAGDITVNADTVEIDDEGGIQASSRGGGTAGTIHIEAKDRIWLKDEGKEPFSLTAALAGTDFFTGIFSTTSAGGGYGGSITLNAPEITASKGAFVATSTVGGGDAGNIVLSADRIRIENGAFVDSTSLPFVDPSDPTRVLPGGKAGSVTLTASESIDVVGRHPANGAASRVASATLNDSEAGEVSLTAPRIVLDGGAVSTGAVPYYKGASGGAGGAITLNASQDLLVVNGGQITASTLGSGQAGRIDIQAGESIRVEGTGSNIASRTGAGGDGGDVELRAPRIEVANGGEISARSEAGLGELSVIVASLEAEDLLADLPFTAEGSAGSIELAADKVLLDGGTIATNAEAADGGNVRILAKQLLHLDRGVITGTVTDDTGGNITIDPEVVLLENGSRIEARAGTGKGGNIQITADNYFAFPGSVVSVRAESELGIDGIVEVHTPDVNLAGELTPLPTTYLDASSLMRERCAARTSGERSGSFAVRGAGGIPPEPDGWLPASFDVASGPFATPLPGSEPGGALLLAQRSCR